MRFKVDEDLHAEVADLLGQHGHDAVTVHDQQRQGQTDDDVAAVLWLAGAERQSDGVSGKNSTAPTLLESDHTHGEAVVAGE